MLLQTLSKCIYPQVKRGSPLRDLLANLDGFRIMVESEEQQLPWPEGWKDRLTAIEKCVANILVYSCISNMS